MHTDVVLGEGSTKPSSAQGRDGWAFAEASHTADLVLLREQHQQNLVAANRVTKAIGTLENTRASLASVPLRTDIAVKAHVYLCQTEAALREALAALAEVSGP